MFDYGVNVKHADINVVRVKEQEGSKWKLVQIKEKAFKLKQVIQISPPLMLKIEDWIQIQWAVQEQAGSCV